MAEFNSTKPAVGAKAVTPSDSTILDCRSLYVGGAGDVSVVTARGDTVTFSAVPVGTTLPIQCNKVRSTSTTATLILALY